MPAIQQLTVNRAAAIIALGYEQVTAGLGAAQPLPSIPDNAAFVLIQSMGGNLRINYADVAATDASGMVIIENDTVQYNGVLEDITFVADAASPATEVNVTYFSYGS